MAQVLDADFLSQVRDADSLSRGVRSMFYFVTPNESSFQHVEEVPLYVQQASPFFIALVLLESLVGWLKRGVPVVTISDGLTSIFAGMVSRLPALLMRGVELTSYIYVWDHYHLFELPWDSAWTWCFTFLGVDFCYYWVHRFAHEVALFWAAHQVHHSSEYFNLPTALRQSLTQQYSSWIFYLPLALAVPPSVFAVHIQFNLLYQFWIHTEVIGNLGPLEFILNTPSHHRVHHGRNLYCIDKNYGGALIIWDRLFGTFAPETDKVVYGLVFPIRTFETFEIQFGYYLYLWRKSRNYETIIHKLSTFLKGPSWSPGKRRLGDHEEVPTVTGEEIPLKSSCPMTLQIYVVVHFVLVLGLYHDVFESKMIMSQVTILAMIGYILLTLTSMGFIIDQRPRAAIFEMMRCVVMVMMQRYGYMKPLLPSLLPSLAVPAFVFLSLLYWVVQSFSQLSTSRCFTGACRLFSQLSPSRCFTGACRLCRASLSWIASQLDSFSQLVNIKKSN